MKTGGIDVNYFNSEVGQNSRISSGVNQVQRCKGISPLRKRQLRTFGTEFAQPSAPTGHKKRPDNRALVLSVSI